MALKELKEKTYYSQEPRFPDFPYAEWKRRIDRVKGLMREHKVDALVLWKRENIRYFFGFQTTHWEIGSLQPATAIIPLDGEPLLVLPDLMVNNAQAFCWTRNIRYQEGTHEVDKIREFPKEVADVILEMGCGNRNIALESGYLGCMWIPRPLNDIETFKSALPKAEFVDGDKVIWGCRMIKSPFEIDRIRQAVGVLTRCHSAIVEKFMPGMTEMDIGKIIHSVEVEVGDFRGGDTAVCHHIVCNQDKEGLNDCLALDDAVITKRDHIVADLQHKHKGYWGDICRVFQVGPVTDRIKYLYELTTRAVDNAAALIRPGVKANELFNAIAKTVVDAGFPRPGMGGHGIGMDIHEPPSIDPFNEMPLEEGMTLALELRLKAGMRRSGGEGLIQYEEQYVCTDKGYERIEGFNRNVIQVSHPIC